MIGMFGALQDLGRSLAFGCSTEHSAARWRVSLIVCTIGFPRSEDCMAFSLIAAIGSPLTTDESLHVAGLEAHLDDQWRHGMTGVLVGGTMGAMQLLGEQTYRDLITESRRLSRERGELLVGVGDAGLTRTRDRLRFVNSLEVDGVVVLSPYLLSFSTLELIDYFTALADFSKHPLYLYDLPGLTRVSLDAETVLKLSGHPNICGMKCSGDFAVTRQLFNVVPPDFRVIVAQAHLVDTLLMDHGVQEHLDGIFSLAPSWVAAIGKAAQAGNRAGAAAAQARIVNLLAVVKQYGVFPAFTVLLNARGIPGNFAPAPFRRLSREKTESLLAEPIVRELLDTPRSAGADGDGKASAATAFAS
jgi:4-hydroxy-tetrahydrodipicolinate synthase